MLFVLVLGSLSPLYGVLVCLYVSAFIFTFFVSTPFNLRLMSCSLSVFLRLNFHFIIFSIFIFDTLSLLLLAFASVPSLQVMVLSLSLFQNLSPLYFVFILMFYLFLISQCLPLLPCLIYASCHGWICSDMASRASYYVCLCIICLSTL